VNCDITSDTAKPIEIGEGCANFLHQCKLLDGKHLGILRWIKGIPVDERGEHVAPYPQENEINEDKATEQKDNKVSTTKKRRTGKTRGPPNKKKREKGKQLL
jgi:pyruvate dehydrogenase complex dehydrogenase (E1) component